MAHKLLIDLKIEFESPFKRFLKPNEVIRGEPITLTLFVTNLGKKAFPGGKVTDWHINYGEQRDITHTSPTANVDCQKIAPNNSVRLLSEDVVPLMEGLAWVWCMIDPKGKDKEVDYHQEPTEPPLEVNGWWCNCFYVVNREMLLLTSAIEELAKRLTQREEGEDERCSSA